MGLKEWYSGRRGNHKRDLEDLMDGTELDFAFKYVAVLAFQSSLSP